MVFDSYFHGGEHENLYSDCFDYTFLSVNARKKSEDAMAADMRNGSGLSIP
jgi:hypothetical protein